MPAGISISEVRQHLFQLADKVVETGEPLLINRGGVQLRLVREDVATEQAGRLARLKPRRQSVVIGAPLDPQESPARWTDAAWSKVAEPPAQGPCAKPSRRQQPQS